MLEELPVAGARLGLLDLVDEVRRPRVHGRVDVAEVPLVGRQLTVGVQVTAVQEQLELLLGELDIDHGQGDRVEREVPRREPRVLPLVGHRDDVLGDEVPPLLVAHAAVRAEGIDAVLGEPALDVEAVVLL